MHIINLNVHGEFRGSLYVHSRTILEDICTTMLTYKCDICGLTVAEWKENQHKMGMGDEGAAHLSRLLKVNHTITSLNLTGSACMYVCMHVCLHVCMYVCSCVCMYVFICVCMYVRTYACMYACLHTYMHVFMYTCMHACMYVCVCANGMVCQENRNHHIAVGEFTYMLIYMHLHIHANDKEALYTSYVGL
jgi:hypothetical protein